MDVNEAIQATLVSDGSNNNNNNNSTRSYVECKVERNGAVTICSLVPNKLESCPLNLMFSKNEVVEFSVIGPSAVNLIGHYLDHSSPSSSSKTEPLGFNIEYSDESWEDSIRKKREKDENKYDVNDSFIDDKSISDDTLFGRLRPLSGKKEKVLKKKTKKKKKKGFVVSESEDDGEGIQLYI
ncbi:hypothetical protein MIMGU_mgv1a021534mg [Erythranthe guttata]|uniref:peptidylprolyl isomerase n=1 Tax=Erythranthe guttata TaxID=4155 RepID=A0A022PZS1_ERYGU|nr:hypothetical protein MIMGU_mgv1a021534mg [Erythranthe guttata]